jgi:hypothetical protein
MVALAGDEQQVIHRGEDSPVTYPEMLLLAYTHGDDAVSDAFELGRVDRENSEELDRLRRVYGKQPVLDVFPGAKPRLPTQDTRIKARVRATPPKRKPIPSRADELADDGDTIALPDPE